ncbi:MAG: MazG-like family protein [Deinococcota bacterium]
MTLDEIQQAVQALCDKQGWQLHTPAERLAYLMAEVGELAEAVLQLEAANTTADNSDINNNINKDIKTHIGHEMYDVIWNVFALANQLEIDVERTFAEKETENQTRVW